MKLLASGWCYRAAQRVPTHCGKALTICKALVHQLAGQQSVQAMTVPTSVHAVLRPQQLQGKARQGKARLQLLRRQSLTGSVRYY